MKISLRFPIIFFICLACFVTIIYAQNFNFESYEEENKLFRSQSGKQEVEIYKAGIRYYPGQKAGNFEVYNKEELFKPPVMPKTEINPKLQETGEPIINRYFNKEQLEKLKKYLEEKNLMPGKNIFEPEGDYGNHLANYTN